MNKASGGSGIPAKLSKILKDDAVKVPRIYTHTHKHTYVSTFGKLSSGRKTGKDQFSL